MTMSSGFFDSVDHDRRYTALQWGQVMDYLISDGVYYRYPETGLETNDKGEANTDLVPFETWICNDNDPYFNPNSPSIGIGPGRAWFDHTWTWVQTPEFVPLPAFTALSPRIDIIVLTMDKSIPARQNYFRAKPGPGITDPNMTPESFYNSIDHSNPTAARAFRDLFGLQGMYMHNDEVHDVPICLVKRTPYANVTKTDIFSLVGLDGQCPYISSIVTEDGSGTFNTRALFEKWNDQWTDFLEATGKEYKEWIDLFGSASDQWKHEWDMFMDERAADYMRWLKMYDRLWHVWYQGSINWTYEYIRRLDDHEEGFNQHWSDVIHKAEDLLANGLTEYQHKIDELVDKMTDMENVVDEKMQELDTKLQEALDSVEDELKSQITTLVEQTVTNNMTNIVNQVVEQASPDILEQMQGKLEEAVYNQINVYMDTDLEELKQQLEQYKNELSEDVQQQIDALLQNYEDLQGNVQKAVDDAVKQAFTDPENTQVADSVVQALELRLQGIVSNYIDQRSEEISEEIYQSISDALDEKIKDAVDKATSSVYKFKGTVSFDSLPIPYIDRVGSVYNVKDGFTTDARFLEGSGLEYPPGTNIAIVDDGTGTAKYDVMTGIFDTSDLAKDADVQALKSTIDSLRNKVDALDTLLTEANNTIREANEKVTQLQTQLSNDYLERD